MVRAILFSLVLYLLGQGRISNGLLACLCSLPVIFSIVDKRDHHHSNLLSMENISNASELAGIHPAPKVVFSLGLILFLVAAKSTALSGLVLVLSIGFFLTHAGADLRSYLDMMAAPVIFIFMSAIGIIVSVTKDPAGEMSVKLFNLYFSISEKSQLRAINLSLVSLASVSCLIGLAITTPIGDIIYFLRKIKCPKVFIEITYLIYRYIFTLSSLLASMQNSANSRLGLTSYKRTLKSAEMIANRLFNKSMRMALDSYSAMESRLYDGEIRFLERDYAESAFAYRAGGCFVLLMILYFAVLK
ncbi:MAG: cobalt ECF transporter T component CbiQ [Firmicutes bacterium]|nr:cobalt ECF transporter T component CbiQ [Bacillota bacterium]